MTDPKQTIDTAQNRFDRAAHELASTVVVQDRIATDPTYQADRSRWADERRAEMRAEGLRRYHEAEEALDAALREGDCFHCGSSLAACTERPNWVCCEDCTHPDRTSVDSGSAS